ncbi:hypothetical protein ACWGPQ_21975 [Saccharomonospora azurea]
MTITVTDVFGCAGAGLGATHTDTDTVAERFARETGEHQMTVLHDAALYRHLRFRSPGHGMYWFDLITVPGTLIFQGDGESFVFRRLPDMFAFFRGSAYQGQPDIDYWAEKLTSGRDSVRCYDQQLLEQHIREEIAEHADELPGLAAAVQEEVLDQLVGDESVDRQLVDEFRYYAEAVPDWTLKLPDFEFVDTFDWQCRGYHWWFEWACHAIVWGIAQYDQHQATAAAAASSERALSEAARKEPGR